MFIKGQLASASRRYPEYRKQSRLRRANSVQLGSVRFNSGIVTTESGPSVNNYARVLHGREFETRRTSVSPKHPIKRRWFGAWLKNDRLEFIQGTDRVTEMLVLLGASCRDGSGCYSGPAVGMGVDATRGQL